ncbi:MAG: GYD domain-containing protein [Phycisphaerales bacterium]|nr:GYD domain-containing protein [Phycisphaerales bacterium]
MINFTDKGIGHVKESVARAMAFDVVAEKAGAKVECQYWTVGAYDGAFILSAPDEKTASGLVLALGQHDNVKTTMLRAFDAEEFKGVVNAMPALG